MKNLIKPILLVTLVCSSGLYVSGCKNENDLEKQTQYDDNLYKGNAEVPQKGRIDQQPMTSKAKH